MWGSPTTNLKIGKANEKSLQNGQTLYTSNRSSLDKPKNLPLSIYYLQVNKKYVVYVEVEQKEKE